MDQKHTFCIRSRSELQQYLKNIYSSHDKLTETPWIDLSDFEFESDIDDLVPAHYAELYRTIPLCIQNGTLAVAISEDIDQYESLKNIAFITGMHVEVFYANSRDIECSLEKVYPNVEFAGLDGASDEIRNLTDHHQIDDLHKKIHNKPVVRAVRHMLLEAINKNASDIHIRPEETHVDYLLRIDGSMVRRSMLSREHLNAIISRFKILGKMDVSEHRVPQDGGAKIGLGEHVVELRFSVIPTIHGESMVIRLLNSDAQLFELQQLGMQKKDYDVMLKSSHLSTGLVLITGPTGSGKSTTLYALLQEIRKDKGLNIISVEDPVEFHIEGVQQIQINKKIGYTFAKTLRNILRHDPDVIMIGEIRDEETAKMAIECALTGHLVLSTLHSVDTISTITRMLEMGVKPYLLKATLSTLLAQRLTKLNCQACLSDDEGMLASQLSEEKDLAHIHWKSGKGCELCHQTGLKGRNGVYESLKVDAAISHVIKAGVSEEEIFAVAAPQLSENLAYKARSLAEKGLISANEFVRLQIR